ncbi:MAG: phosphate-starvation-inducible PsiE family protein [Lachnospirales bacterium]
MRDLQNQIPNLLYRIAQFLEILVGVILVAATCVALLAVVREVGTLWDADGSAAAFHAFLGNAFSVVIGVEFLKMLCRHNMSSVVEVVLFATARQMVVEHTNPTETLVMVLALAILFLIRKYLFIPGLDDKDHTVHLPFSRREEREEQTVR